LTEELIAKEVAVTMNVIIILIIIGINEELWWWDRGRDGVIEKRSVA